MRARTGHIVEKLVLVAVHDGRANDGRLREGLLDALLALELGAVEDERRAETALVVGLIVEMSVEEREVDRLVALEREAAGCADAERTCAGELGNIEWCVPARRVVEPHVDRYAAGTTYESQNVSQDRSSIADLRVDH